MSNQIFKKGGLIGPQIMEGVCVERGGDIIQEGGGVQFPHKNKSKSEIFNRKKIYGQNFFSLSKLRVQTGKFKLRIKLLLNDKILLRVNNVDIFGVH